MILRGKNFFVCLFVCCVVDGGRKLLGVLVVEEETRGGCLVTYAADGDGVYTAASGHGPAGDAVHGLAIQKGKDLPAGAILATGKRDAPTKVRKNLGYDGKCVIIPYCLFEFS